MKKTISAFVLMAVMLSGLTACGNNSSSSGEYDSNISIGSEKIENYLAGNEDSLNSINDGISPGGETSENPPITNSPPAITPAPSPKAPTTTNKPPVTSSPNVTPAPGPSSSYVSEVVRLVNIERQKAGVPPLTMSGELNNAAGIRANEIIQSFSHTRPNGTSCFTVLSELNISYRTCGENIAAGQPTPAKVVEGWMNSEGHRRNILNGSYTKIGVGYVTGGSYGTNWVQLFTG